MISQFQFAAPVLNNQFVVLGIAEFLVLACLILKTLKTSKKLSQVSKSVVTTSYLSTWLEENIQIANHGLQNIIILKKL